MSNKTAHICFCVEGMTEIEALRFSFADLFDNMFGEKVDVHFREPVAQGKKKGDLTSLYDVTPENIEKNIYKYYFKSQDKNSDISWDDFTYIIHVVDIDGAYIKDEIRLFDENELQIADKLGTRESQKNILYYDDHIAVRNSIQNIEKRNEQKRRNLEYLRGHDEISISPKKPSKKYRIFYFASNLDHFLFGKANISRQEKIAEARDFAHFIDDADLLTEFFRTNPNCNETDYCRSWDILRKKNNSLRALSNINILIEEILHSKLDDWL